MYLTNDRDLAEDLTQESFARFWESLHNFRGECSMLTWATKIAHRTWCDYQRQQGRERRLLNQPMDTAPSAELPEQALEQVVLRCSIAQALQQLSEIERQVVALVKIEGFSYREASAILEEPEGTLRWRVNEALVKLKVLLTDSEEPEGEGDGQDVRLHKA